MKFIRDLIGRKKRAANSSPANGDIEALEKSYRDTIGAMSTEREPAAVTDILTDVAQKTAEAARADADVRVVQVEEPAAPVAEVNIWDMEDGGGSTELPTAAPTLTASSAPAAAAAASRSPARSRRTKTRLIGFEKSDGDVVDLFNDAPRAAQAAVRAKFPVGWITVTEGPGRGESFSLLAGMSQIGRGEDQAVKLDFGDNSISRTNHAAIVYDPDNKEFLLGHGGKSNIVRLNDKPLISTENLKSGDIIRIGETVLHFVALCGETFSWADGGNEEDEDVAIA